ncbi:Ycf66 family protein [Vulcanococcus limneticus Candia 3F8]|uniref:Ycf66 family protein n=1 Tax=Vulcanococcus limneticus TaxID=2170428 RepID=UPI000B97FCC2|nr:Ycf66 family protein [Vulcanococcus limneticus]MCP9792512.1 Ycf66 family protein [Vulcanococcus limneticus MW73D5]MCP9894237.1 Ycf66 family protein [Vulcanococcus limneticus Candia 3F8]MCP9897860.1 Ycf66 family protein [Vulcanococcus limneticus Candia 3B3]
MVNASLNWASIVGIVLAVGGAFLYFMRSFKPALARDYDVFFAAVGLLCGGILFFQGWRLDPILQFGQFLLAGTTVFFAYESVRLRGVTTEQARRSSYFDDEEAPVRPRMGGGRDWGDDVDRFDEPQPLRRRIRSRDEAGYDASEEDDFYRPRRPARAAIPERAASRSGRGPAADLWDRSDREPGAPPEPRGAEARGSEADDFSPRASRYSAGGGAPRGASGAPSSDFGARRQGREEQRRGSRPVAASDDLPRSSRRPTATGPSAGGADASPAPGARGRQAGIPQGSPYSARPTNERGSAAAGGRASQPGVSDADFSPIRPGGPSKGPTGSPATPGGAAPGAPRDNSSRFDD